MRHLALYCSRPAVVIKNFYILSGYQIQLSDWSVCSQGVSPHRWSLQRERLEQLSMQAVYNITHHNDEFVKDFLITHEKVRTLKLSSCVHCIILKKAIHFQALCLYTTL